MKKSACLLLLSFMIILSSCSTGLHPELMSKVLDDSAFKGEVSQAKQNLGNLIVWMDIDTMDSDGTVSEKWRWDKKEFNIVYSYLESLKREGKINTYNFIKSSEIEKESTEAFLAKVGESSDTALIIRTVVQLDKYFNPAALLDLTIICAYLIPGSNRDALAKTRVELIDLKSKTLLYASENTQIAKITKPTFLIDSEEALSEAKVKSIREAMRGLFSKIMQKQNLLEQQ